MHVLHTVRPGTSEYVPCGHGEATTAATELPNEPAGIDKHAAKPEVKAYVPIEQFVHWSAPFPVLDENLPGAHAKHDVAPGEGIYVPDGHCTQNAWPTEFCALPLAQFSQLVCPLFPWYLPALHDAHEVALVLIPKNPTAHGLHTNAPVESVYEPAEQAEHTVKPIDDVA